ncbi:hypothetical protein Oweho_3264 [Owenweeksia hongkongensis DSM 17368]|uniref:Coenzyme Q-binding protein COQ10 START domain-containing protein n=1 Tax=Owenweeksia hongkongensis (strain DSM 17368 / CIP 108786 / JCM 12287 / NRRL B-23963 / UST20020801) TaxID=926562 RepID=G8R4B5_OWEHD|nr:SRPBCC family protein [Owenweeksia hongkongensis]AEV34215.1 hypothetical protein Oweho_3264 [Owenweeksia hongkongensis DSM 17368]
MSIIFLETKISAPIDRVFDLSRRVEFQLAYFIRSKVKIIKGKKLGPLDSSESTIWRVHHFGFQQQYTLTITDFYKPTYFVYQLKGGIFKSFRHEYHFSFKDGTTTMSSVLRFSPRTGLMGMLINFFFLRVYLTHLVMRQNMMIKKNAESPKESV